jgi:hypothetical protein
MTINSKHVLQTVFVTVLASLCNGFSIVQQQTRLSTALQLDKSVADMIDNELYRLNHKKEYENTWMEKNRAVIYKALAVGEKSQTSFDMLTDDEERRQTFRQLDRDRRMAKADPFHYCADRCVATGNCEVYEDL